MPSSALNGCAGIGQRNKSFFENVRRRIDYVITKTYAGGLAWPI
jgi:hypothetical protein